MDGVELEKFRLVEPPLIDLQPLVRFIGGLAAGYAVYSLFVILVFEISSGDGLPRTSGFMFILALVLSLGVVGVLVFRRPIRILSRHDRLRVHGVHVKALVIHKTSDVWPTGVGDIEKRWLTFEVRQQSHAIRFRTRVDELTYHKFRIGTETEIVIDTKTQRWCIHRAE